MFIFTKTTYLQKREYAVMGYKLKVLKLISVQGMKHIRVIQECLEPRDHWVHV